MAGLMTVTDETFEATIDQSRGVALVEFGAAWCGPCKAIAPVLEAMAQEHADVVRIATLDVDANPRTAMRFGVRGLPTMLFFRDGSVVDRVVGAVPRSVLESRLEALGVAAAPASERA